MLNTLTNSVFPLYWLSTAIAFLFPFLKDKIFKQLSLAGAVKALQTTRIVILPFVIFFILAQVLSLQAAAYCPYLFGGIALPAILTAINLPSRLKGIVMLLAGVLLVQHLPEGSNNLFLIACAAGVLSWKITDCLLSEVTGSFDDVLPMLSLLIGIYYISASGSQTIGFQQGLLLGTLSVMLLLRLLEGPFLSKDPIYMKRLMLSATGGLAVLIVISKLLLSPHLGSYGLLAGGAIFVTYLLQEREDRTNTALDALHVLILIGLATLVAYRLFGGFGLILAATTTIVGNGKWLSQAMGFFFVSRVLLQGYVAGYVANVTGINTTHPYVGLSLYGGMLLILITSLALRDLSNRRILITLFLLLGTVIPCLSNYYLHAEAGGGLLQASAMAAILLVVLAPVLYQKELPNQALLVVLPAQMLAIAIMANELITLGDTASVTSKISIMAYLTAALLVTSTIGYKICCRSGSKPVKISGD